MPGTGGVTEQPAWKALEEHRRHVRDVHLRALFASDPRRGERLTAEAAGVYLDYSKNRVTDETLRLLVRLADDSGLRARIDAMFGGEKINVSEQRAVLHVALRAPRGTSIVLDGENVVPGVHAVKTRGDRLSLTVEQLHKTLPLLVGHIQQNGRTLTSLSTHHATLEDVFVNLTGRHLRD